MILDFDPSFLFTLAAIGLFVILFLLWLIAWKLFPKSKLTKGIERIRDWFGDAIDWLFHF
jgi:hypothetical protein